MFSRKWLVAFAVLSSTSGFAFASEGPPGSQETSEGAPSEETDEVVEAPKDETSGRPRANEDDSQSVGVDSATPELTTPPYVRRLGRTVGEQGEGYAERSLGARAAFSNTPDGASAAILERGAAWLSGDVLTARYEDELFLGHSERDIVYRAALQAAMGLRWSLSSGGGPFLRAGLRAGIEQDGGLRLATIQLPMLEVGYQFVRSGRVIDFAISAAPLVAGYFESGGLSAPLGGGAFGGTAAMVLSPALLALDASLLPAGDRGFVADGRSRVCWLGNFEAPTATHRTGDPRRPLVVGPGARDAGISVCGYGRVTSFAALEDPRRADSPIYSLGLTLSFGAHSLLDRAL